MEQTTQSIIFGAEINVAILTDKVCSCAYELDTYLRKGKDITVNFTHDLDGVRLILEHNPIDFLIIVEYLNNTKYYRAIQEVTELNKYASIIMYASLDYVIDEICDRYEIEYKYDSYLPISGFISYMFDCYDKKNMQLFDDFPQLTDEEKNLFDTSVKRRELRAEILREKKDSAKLNEQANLWIEEEKAKSKRKSRIFSWCIAATLIIFFSIFFGYAAYESSLPFEIDRYKEYRYTFADVEYAVNISVKGETVSIMTDIIFTYDGLIKQQAAKSILTLENAITYEIVCDNIRAMRGDKAEVFNENKLLAYCNAKNYIRKGEQ